jgi:hypothetical protein
MATLSNTSGRLRRRAQQDGSDRIIWPPVAQNRGGIAGPIELATRFCDDGARHGRDIAGRPGPRGRVEV